MHRNGSPLNAEIQPGNFHSYYGTVISLLMARKRRECEECTKFFSCEGPHALDTALWVYSLDDEFRDRRLVDEVFDDLVALHLRVLFYLGKNEYEEAFNAQKALLQYFLKEILAEEKDTNWFIPILFVLCKDLRVIASMADKAREIIDEDENSFYEEAANPIMECYRICAADGRNSFDISKKVATLNLTNQLFRIYYRINRLPLLKPLIRAIDVSKESELYGLFSMVDKVTYNYYVGRKAIFDNDLGLAEDSLSHAFQNCPPNCEENKRLILLYMIPVKMFLGYIPSAQLLEKYNLGCFKGLVEAVRDGNMTLFSNELKSQETFFIDSGIYLMLEKLRLTTFLNMVKTISKVLNGHQIKIEAVVDVCKGQKYDMDAEEASCILANLIYQKKIKGYISYTHQTLVISKQDPFPVPKN